MKLGTKFFVSDNSDVDWLYESCQLPELSSLGPFVTERNLLKDYRTRPSEIIVDRICTDAILSRIGSDSD